MGEVKRYDAVHIRYEDHNIRYGEGCEVEMVAAQDYDALRAENERLRKVTHVMIPTDTMEQEFAKYHRRGFDAGIKQGLAENAKLVAALVSTASMLNDVIGADSADRTILGKIETDISAALAKHRGE